MEADQIPPHLMKTKMKPNWTMIVLIVAILVLMFGIRVTVKVDLGFSELQKFVDLNMQTNSAVNVIVGSHDVEIYPKELTAGVQEK